MILPENYLAVRILAEYDGALLNAEGKPIKALNGLSLQMADEDAPLDEELLEKPGMVAIAEVVQACAAFSPFPEILEVRGEIVGSELFENEIRVGDLIALKQNEIDRDDPVTEDETSPIWAVPYSAALCILVGKNQLYPVGGYTIAKPVYPHGTTRELVDGKMDLVRKNKHGVIFDYKVKPLLGQGEVAFLGKPLVGESLPVAVGERVMYELWTSGPTYLLQGQKYYCVRHPDLAGVMPADADVVSMGESRYSRTVARPIRDN